MSNQYGDEQQMNEQQRGGRSRFRRLRRGTGNLVDGADGSIFWFIKWVGQQMVLAAEAVNQMLVSAQTSAQRRVEDERARQESDQDSEGRQ